MARAASTDYKKFAGGTYPGGWTPTSIDDLTDIADYIIDGYTYPYTISTTSNAAKAINLQVTERLRLRADVGERSSGVASAGGVTYPDLIILTEEIKERIKSLLKSSSDTSGFLVLDLMRT